MQEFYINKDSLNPPLRIELIDDGRFDTLKSYIFNNVIQDSKVTFSMRNTETGILKISKGKVDVLSLDDCCNVKHILQYSWKPRDVKEKGIYQGWFEIKFNGDIREDGIDYPTGNLIVPIKQDLIIYIK